MLVFLDRIISGYRGQINQILLYSFVMNLDSVTGPRPRDAPLAPLGRLKTVHKVRVQFCLKIDLQCSTWCWNLPSLFWHICKFCLNWPAYGTKIPPPRSGIFASFVSKLNILCATWYWNPPSPFRHMSLVLSAAHMTMEWRWSDPVSQSGWSHRRMAGGGQGLPKVSPGPTMPDPSMPCRRPAVIFYPFEHPTPYAYDGRMRRCKQGKKIIRLYIRLKRHISR
jgi:hypothetical protein